MRLPSGLNATLDTVSVWPVSGCADGLAGGGVPQPHRLVVAAGDDALAVGAERHTEHRVGVAGERLADRLAGVRVPQPHRVVVLPETMRCPSGLNATLDTRSVWPVSGWPIGWPVSASHSRTVLSRLPETIRLPSGLNATLVTGSGVAGQRRADRAGRCPRPTAAPSCRHCRRRCGRPSGLNATLHHRAGVAGQRLRRRLAGVRVPHPHGVVALPETMRCPSGLNATLDTSRCGRSAAGRSAGRWPRPTAAPCCRHCRRRCAARRG